MDGFFIAGTSQRNFVSSWINLFILPEQCNIISTTRTRESITHEPLAILFSNVNMWLTNQHHGYVQGLMEKLSTPDYTSLLVWGEVPVQMEGLKTIWCLCRPHIYCSVGEKGKPFFQENTHYYQQVQKSNGNHWCTMVWHCISFQERFSHN